MKFSEYFYNKRVSMGYTLRRFCEAKGYDPAYISRIENGIISPPEDKEKLKALAMSLELEEGSVEWVKFFDLASISRGKIPEDLSKNPRIAEEFLPAFYRGLRKDKLSKSDIAELLQSLKGEKEDEGAETKDSLS